MINNKKCLLVVSIVSALSGCASLDNSPYYRSWHDRAYAMRDFEQGNIPHNSANIPMVFVNGKAIPEAEPQATQTIPNTAGSAPTDSWNHNALNEFNGEPTSNNPDYSVDGDPFKSYNNDTNGDEKIYRAI